MSAYSLERASQLHLPENVGVQLEYESTVEFTMNPDWGINVAKILLEEMQLAQEQYGLKSSLRMTVNDNREFERPPLMRSGKNWDDMDSSGMPETCEDRMRVVDDLYARLSAAGVRGKVMGI